MLPPNLTPTRPSSNQRRLTPPAPDAHESPDPTPEETTAALNHNEKHMQLDRAANLQHRYADRHYTEYLQCAARPIFTDEHDKPPSLPAHLQTIHDSIQCIPCQRKPSMRSLFADLQQTPTTCICEAASSRFTTHVREAVLSTALLSGDVQPRLPLVLLTLLAARKSCFGVGCRVERVPGPWRGAGCVRRDEGRRCV